MRGGGSFFSETLKTICTYGNIFKKLHTRWRMQLFQTSFETLNSSFSTVENDQQIFFEIFVKFTIRLFQTIFIIVYAINKCFFHCVSIFIFICKTWRLLKCNFKEEYGICNEILENECFTKTKSLCFESKIQNQTLGQARLSQQTGDAVCNFFLFYKMFSIVISKRLRWTECILRTVWRQK